MDVGVLDDGTPDAGVAFTITTQLAVFSLTAKDLLDEPTFAHHDKAFLVRAWGTSSKEELAEAHRLLNKIGIPEDEHERVMADLMSLTYDALEMYFAECEAKKP